MHEEAQAASDDPLTGAISDDLWSRKSQEREAEPQRVRTEIERPEQASHEYEATGLPILELAPIAHLCMLRRIPTNRCDW
jgi:hypothetical protein